MTNENTSVPLNTLRVAELQALAAELGVMGASKLRKGELVEAITEKRAAAPAVMPVENTAEGEADVATTTPKATEQPTFELQTPAEPSAPEAPTAPQAAAATEAPAEAPAAPVRAKRAPRRATTGTTTATSAATHVNVEEGAEANILDGDKYREQGDEMGSGLKRAISDDGNEYS